MFWSKNKENRDTPAKILFIGSEIKVGFDWVHISRTCFSDVILALTAPVV